MSLFPEVHGDSFYQVELGIVVVEDPGSDSEHNVAQTNWHGLAFTCAYEADEEELTALHGKD